MTAGELRTLTVAQMQGMGARMDDLVVWPSSDSGVWGLLTEGLQKWCGFSLHLREAEVAFTLTTGEVRYGLRSNAFAESMKRIDTVRDDQGRCLANLKGGLGRITRAELDEAEVNWGSMSPARPSVWLMEGEGTIRVYPEPDDDYAFTVAGVIRHPAITADADEIQVEPEDEMAVARFLAALWAMKSGQANEAISLAYQEGIKAAEARSASVTQRVQPFAGGISGGVMHW